MSNDIRKGVDEWLKHYREEYKATNCLEHYLNEAQKYRKEIKGKAAIYSLIYERALKKGWVKEVNPENISRNMRRRLQYHCELQNIPFPGTIKN